MRYLVSACCLLLVGTAVAGCQPGAQTSTTRQAATLTPQPTATATFIPVPGSISGTLMYPADAAPPLQIYAVAVTDSHRYYSVKTSANQLDFSIWRVLPGTYHVLGYVQAGFMTGNAKVFAGGYTRMATCMPSDSTCPADHTLLDVMVLPGEVIAGIRVWDWYAPAGTFPPPPGS